MNCKETKKWMSPYLDSELGATKTFEVSEHLRVCPECAARFEAERHADVQMREGLSREAMPDELWNRIEHTVTASSRLRFPVARRYWAIAALLAFAVGAWLVMSLPAKIFDDAPFVIQNFVAQAPRDEPFVNKTSPQEPEIALASLNAVLRETFGMSFTVPGILEEVGHRTFEIVSTARRTDELGREYVEVRLNCCGDPVLMVLARPTNGDWPLGLEQFAVVEKRSQKVNGVHLDVRDVGDVRAVWTSRHSPGIAVLSSLSLLDA